MPNSSDLQNYFVNWEEGNDMKHRLKCNIIVGVVSLLLGLLTTLQLSMCTECPRPLWDCVTNYYSFAYLHQKLPQV